MSCSPRVCHHQFIYIGYFYKLKIRVNVINIFHYYQLHCYLILPPHHLVGPPLTQALLHWLSLLVSSHISNLLCVASILRQVEEVWSSYISKPCDEQYPLGSNFFRFSNKYFGQGAD